MKRKSRSRSRSRSRSPFTIDWPARDRPPPIFHGTLPQPHLRGPTLPQLQPPATIPLQPSHPSYHHLYGHTPLPGPHEERIRRNVACVNCRNSKVRCLSSAEGKPCQRCEKLQLECEVKKDHKRITKRNKLEDLEKELNSLKQAVNSQPSQSAPESITTTTPSARTSTSGLDSTSSWASQVPRPSPTKVYAPPVSASRHVTTQVLTPHSETPGSVSQYQPETATRTRTAESRTLGDITVSGEDVDFYFDKYMQYYHPLLPLLRQKDPDKCYEVHATLFWTILYVSLRRFAKSVELYNGIVDELSNTPWLMLSTASATLESVHALLIICNWPLPTIRILTDPCPSLLAVATVASMQLGLHLGKGTGEAFGCGERHNAKCTDEEAASTWLACCTLATRASTAAGIPPPSIQYDDQVCRESLEGSSWEELIALYDIQKWLNRFHAAMAAQLASGQPISTMSVSLWESDFDSIKPYLVRRDTDILRVAVLSARLEIQTYYLANPPSPPPPPLAAHIKSIYTTCRNLLILLRTLDSSSDYLRHHPQWSFRALLDASSFIIFSLHQRNLCCPDLTDIEATEIAQEAWTALHRCSVRDGDIAWRVSSFMETFWGIRDGIPRKPLPVGSWRTRLAVGVTFWCLKQIKISLVNAKKLPDDTKIGNEHTLPEKEPPKGQSPPPETPAKASHDPFLGVDWSFFIEDFGWSGAEFGYTGQ